MGLRAPIQYWDLAGSCGTAAVRKGARPRLVTSSKARHGSAKQKLMATAYRI